MGNCLFFKKDSTKQLDKNTINLDQDLLFNIHDDRKQRNNNSTKELNEQYTIDVRVASPQIKKNQNKFYDYPDPINEQANGQNLQRVDRKRRQKFIEKLMEESKIFEHIKQIQKDKTESINYGTVEIIINNEVKKQLQKGESFGELALLYNAPRSATVKCTVKCGFWAIDRQTFKSIVEEMVAKQAAENRDFIEKVSFFSKFQRLIKKLRYTQLDSLTNEQKQSVANVIISERYLPDQYIVNEGDQASSFYVIKEANFIENSI